MTNILEAQDITKVFSGGPMIGKKRVTVAVDDISIEVRGDPPAIITVAGESGSGKTTLSRLLLGLIEPSGGRVTYRGKDLSQMTHTEWRTYRENVQAIYQDPYEVYNPFYKVDHALTLPLKSFRPRMSRRQRLELVANALESVGLRPGETLGRHAHQLSGGQRQRVMIARALLLDPDVIIADEPVSMVDASLRAIILESLLKVHEERDISLFYITHDLATAYQLSQTILMLYEGTAVEAGDIDLVIKNPLHPYTQLLVSCIPLPDPKQRWGGDEMNGDDLERTLERTEERLEGCMYANRCPHAMPLCYEGPPPLYGTDSGRGVACYLYKDSPPLDRQQVLALYTLNE